jgi:hypothetical protein
VEALRPRLRVGVFADSASQPRWVVEALARAAATPFAELSVVVVGRGEERTGDRLFFSHGGATRSAARKKESVPMLWRAYSGVDRAFFGSSARWSAPRDVTLLVPEERRIVRAGNRCWRACVCDARLDVAFVLGAIDGAALDGAARFGTWRFCFGETHGTSEPLAGVREVLQAHPVMASGIRIHRPGGQPDRLACQSWARTFPFSMARSRDALFAKTAEFLSRALRDLHAGGMKWVDHGTEPARAPGAEAFPSLAGVVRDIGTMGARVAQRAAEKALTVEQWSIAYRFSRDEGWNGSLEGFHRLDPPRGWYWADPFPIQVNGRSYIFFEELPYGAPKAHISVVEVDREGRASKPVKVLEREYHLSYPFLVEEDGQLYMIPETAHNNTVEIYRCVDFPGQWRLERVLMKDVFCADATLHREGDRWWMFTNAAKPGEEINDELYLFSSERLLGDWKPHRRNPVKSDVRGARPAGRLFRRGSRLYRPGQICAPHYGSGIALNRVTRLTHDEYVEEEERRIVPRSQAVLGIHTINRAGDLSVTDAFTRSPRF